MSAIYASARQTLLTGGMTWPTARVFATLVSALYVPSFEADATRSVIPAGAILTPSVLLTGLAATDGFAEAAGVDFGTISTAAAIAAILLTIQPGDVPAGTDALLLYLNQGAGFGVQADVTPVSVIWNAQGIWRP